MAEAAVRPALPTDVAEIARIQVTTWQTGYADLLPPDVLASLDAEAAATQWLRTVEQGPASVLVATEGRWVVGFCSAGPSPESESAAADGSPAPDAATVGLVATLLVEPRWGRRGHGTRLLAAAVDALRGAGMTRAIAWTPEQNTAGKRFYQRAGWTPDGVLRTLDAGGRPLREIRFTGPVALPLE
ncbi:N-acetyltransferase family protein [Actinokineospora sp. NPDC004072]